MERLRAPERLNFEGNVSENWRKFRQNFDFYLVATELDTKSDKVQISLLLTVAGEAAIEVYNTFTYAEGEDKDKLDTILSKFEQYCMPRKNVTFERHQFFMCVQNSGDSIDQYVTELKMKSKSCEFGDLNDSLIRDRIICGIDNQAMKERLLREHELTLQKAIDMCRAAEISKTQIRSLTLESEKSVQSVHYPKTKQHYGAKQKTYGQKQNFQKRDANTKHSHDNVFRCGKCGSKHGLKQCPAFGHSCHGCGKLNHFRKCCRAKQTVHSINDINHDEPEMDTLFIGAINSRNASKQSNSCMTEQKADECLATLDVQGTSVRFKIDTGSQANIIPSSTFQEMDTSEVKVQRSVATLTSYTGDNLKIMGKCTLKCLDIPIEFYIAETDQLPILRFRASQDLGLIKVVMTMDLETKEDIVKGHHVFDGLGCLPQPYHINIDPTVQPVINAPRNVPAALREKLEKTLKEMEANGVIKKVDGPTDWVNSLVVVEKPKTGQLRICLDPRNLNEAIRREHFQLPTIEDITTRLSGAKLFSKLDANHGYWQILLDEPSQLLTTFNTPIGRFCYLGMPFGIKSAQEVFQKRMTQHFGDLPGVETDIDDILVWGSSVEEHNQRLKAVLERCQQINLTLNKEKCEFGVSEIGYIGHWLTPEGVKPDNSKISAIVDMPAPEDKKGVERLLGTVNYLAKFVPNLSAITEPIRKFLQKDIAFHWFDEQQKAFQDIKDILTREPGPVLQFYDVTKPVTISCDASKSGLGAVLLQNNKPVAFASRSLTTAEIAYAQIEKELLAVLFSLERFNQYTYGKDVLVESDHRPLESIIKKPLASAPPRLQRMLLRLQKYTFTLMYKPGKELIVADTLSRAYLNSTENTENSQEDIEFYVHTVMSNLPVSDQKLMEIKNCISTDESMKKLHSVILEGWPETKWSLPPEIQSYWHCRDELSEVDGIILRGETIIIPTTMRREMLERIHIGHMGVEKSRRRARDIIYWPGMSAEIADMVTKCSTCLEHRDSNQKETMIPSAIPSRPWETVATDLFTWDGDNYLLIVDYYSRYFEVAKLTDTQSYTVITHTKSTFARHGIPTEVRSDNGPQYTSHEYKDFSKKWGFVHTTTSPYHAQSNGLVEKAVNTVKTLLQKAKDDHKEPYLGLLEYRNTPLDGIGSPAQMLMGRRLRSTLPTTNAQLQPSTISPSSVQSLLRKKQQQQKHFYGPKTYPH